MKATIRFAATFEREYKALRKKYPSLSADVLGLVEELEDNPRMGTPLGRNAYKIRLKVSSKGKGKSGGGRVISLVDAVALLEGEPEQPTKVTLLSIDDKSEQESVSEQRLIELIRAGTEGI